MRRISLCCLAVMLLMLGIAGCAKSLEPSDDGRFHFHGEDLPQIEFLYDPGSWLMTVSNKTDISAKIKIQSNLESNGISFTLGGFKEHSYHEYYESNSTIHIAITRLGEIYKFTVKLKY
ncbi:MAG: hypothetical protein WCV50_05610 [Patescibacteria group bacterium]